MFNKVNGSTYTLTNEIAEGIISSCINIFQESPSDVDIEPTIYEMSIRRLISYKIAVLVISNFKDTLIKNGFLAIVYSGDISGVVSVGLVDDKLVYDDLIK